METAELNKTTNYKNAEIKNEYLQYLIYGKSNEKNLNFGNDPLMMYKDLTSWFMREKNKIQEISDEENVVKATEVCRTLLDKMNELNATFSSLPILKIPSGSKFNPQSHFMSLKRKRHRGNIKEEDDKKFICKLCSSTFNTGQGLGGHVSRIHQGQSENYNKKKATRQKREEERKILYTIKKTIVESKGFKYDELLKDPTKSGKMMIKRIIEENHHEYVRLKREMKKKSY